MPICRPLIPFSFTRPALAMSFHNVFDNGEPKAGSPLIPGARLIHPEKTLRHPLKIFFIDPYTAILHIELQPGRTSLRILNSDLYITPWLVILHAVFDQVDRKSVV